MPESTLQINQASLPEQLRLAGDLFPLVYQCKNSSADLSEIESWLAQNATDLEQLADRHGAILFRGFPVRLADDFDRFIAAFGWENFAYQDSLSNAVRINRTPRVFTANEAPPSVSIFLHHELAQTPVAPSKLFFFCEQAAETGGATPLCRSDALWNKLQEECPAFAAACVNKGLKYTNIMPAQDDLASGMGRSWQSTLNATTRDEAEGRLRSLNYSWEWLPDESLRATTPVLPAVRQLSNGRKSFFNQLIAAFRGWKDQRNDPSKAIRHGDDTPLDRNSVDRACTLAEEFVFDLNWQSSDVALVDNHVTMHGRRTFTGTRRVLASLVAAG